MFVLYTWVLFESLVKAPMWHMSHRITNVAEHVSLGLSQACTCVFHMPHYVCLQGKYHMMSYQALTKNV